MVEESFTLFASNHSSAYFLTLGLDDERASELHHKYYTQYGLALRGLVKHHEIGKVSISFINHLPHALNLGCRSLRF